MWHFPPHAGLPGFDPNNMEAIFFGASQCQSVETENFYWRL